MWELLTLALTRLLFCLNLIHALSLLLNYNVGTLFQQSNTLSDKECHQWQHVTGKEVCLDLLMNVIASKHLYWAMLPFTNTHTRSTVGTYMVPLQEHQRPAAVLMQQLLSALLHGQLSLSDLLALHQDAAHSYGLHHGIHTAGLAQVYILYDEQKE